MNMQSLLTDLTGSCEAALTALPPLESIAPPKEGISLLDVKNDIFLSYIQSLALRNLIVVRNIKAGKSWAEVQALNDSLTRHLVQQRVYLDKAVRPLEARIKYQVDKVIKAAADEEAKAVKTAVKVPAGESESEEEPEELAFRPNAAAFIQEEKEHPAKRDGVYRPPRISATAMPDIDQREKRERKPMRSTTVDEYITNEMSAAPSALPSVGSTIVDGGRRTKNARTMAEEAERQEYEETHLVRLPVESKKERAKKKARDRNGFGGEDLQSIGVNVDRIGDLTRKSKLSALDKSRKRRAVEDGPRGDGAGAFEVKRKRLDKKMRR